MHVCLMDMYMYVKNMKDMPMPTRSTPARLRTRVRLWWQVVAWMMNE